MNRFVIITFLMLLSLTSKGQVARWLIPNEYDSIYIAQGANVVITHAGQEKTFWGFDGTRLNNTTGDIYAFVDGCATIVQSYSSNIKGFFRLSDGKIVALKNCMVAHNYPYFSDQRLLLRNGKFYRFVDIYGKLNEHKLKEAYPFHNGYASCITYHNIEKEKSPYPLLLTKNFDMVTFSYNGKVFDVDDVDFISSVNDENLGVVVIKRKIYFFNGQDQSLSPIFANKGDTNIKNQGKLQDDISVCLTHETDSTTILDAKSGKTGKIQIRFDKFMVPRAIIRNNDEYKFHFDAKRTRSFQSPLRKTEKNNLFGINWEKREVLPPQFEQVGTLFDSRAFVKLEGKYGMLKILDGEHFSLTLNKGNDIAFRHKKFETKLRVDMSTSISSQMTSVEIMPETGCNIDKTSKLGYDTRDGNFVEYDCVLSIPQSLPDDVNDANAELTYPVQILYYGLKSPIINLKTKAWHFKYLTPDINENERSVQQGLFSFIIDISAERIPGDETYYVNVWVESDSTSVTPEKISETRYRCRELPIHEGVNNIIIYIQEEGCPPQKTLFEITYTRPSTRTKKSGLSVKKTKTKVQPTQPVNNNSFIL